MAGGRFYFDWANYRTMLGLLRKQPDRVRRWKSYAAFGFGVPAVAAVHAVCFALDPILSGSLRRTEVREPVFCVGHARSGTTLLHRLMAADPQFSYFLLYEMFFPSLLQKRLLRAVFRLDAAVFGGRLRRRLEAVEAEAFGDTNDMHRTGFFAPEEDDFVLTSSLASGFWMVLFPFLGELDFYHVDEWSERKRRRLMTFYRECVRRQIALNAGGTHLSKNPTFCGRVEALIETFPDAKFIVPMRNPYQTIPSLLKMMQTAWRLRGRDELLIEDSLRFLADQSLHSYVHPLEVLQRYPNTPRSIVDYRDLVTAPEATLRRAYGDLGLRVGPETLRMVQGGAGHESSHEYSVAEFGLDPQLIRARLAELFERFHWDPEEERAHVR
ncbi:MAG: sulfotransferase [Actinomycetota bacterium]|nr:sulfotransferase [Actinomycetota bacterium]